MFNDLQGPNDFSNECRSSQLIVANVVIVVDASEMSHFSVARIPRQRRQLLDGLLSGIKTLFWIKKMRL